MMIPRVRNCFKLLFHCTSSPRQKGREHAMYYSHDLIDFTITTSTCSPIFSFRVRSTSGEYSLSLLRERCCQAQLPATQLPVVINVDRATLYVSHLYEPQSILAQKYKKIVL